MKKWQSLEEVNARAKGCGIPYARLIRETLKRMVVTSK
jgi:hypothetical protein